MKKYIFILIFLFSIFSVNANSINYQIIDDSVLVEMNFDSVDDLELKLPYDYKALEVNNEYKINETRLFVSDAKNLSVKYITKAPIEKSSEKYFFIINKQDNLSLDKIVLKLPEKAVLPENYVVFPKNHSLNTDGRNIIIEWKNPETLEIVVSYEILDNNEIYHYLVYMILLIIIIYLFRYRIFNIFRNNVKKQKAIEKPVNQEISEKESDKKDLKKTLTKNLFGDEKRIIEYLIDKEDNECWTKEILRDLNISKIKLSRKLRSLTQKELIKKIPFGNENRIRLIISDSDK